jgi:hypothetical protein
MAPYNKDQWIASFEDAMVKLRPHMSARVLDTLALTMWHKHGRAGDDPHKAAREWHAAMGKK